MKGLIDMFLIIINQILKMLLLLLLGCICYKTKLVDQSGNKALANLLLMVVNPILAVMALQTDYSPELVRRLLLAFVLAIAVHAGAILMSTILVRKTGNQDYAIERCSAIYSNCGFMGIPLVQSILGSEGVLYLTAFMTVFNICTWTHGVTQMTGKVSLQNLKKGLLSPMIIASIIGLILFFAQIRLPGVIADTLNYVKGMNTPLAMMIAGISVAQTDPGKMFLNKRLYFISFIKLMLMPSLVLLFLALIHVNSTVACTVLIASACPVAATCTAFSLRFRKNYKYCSELYAFTTLCSLVTIPIFVYAAERLLV